MKRLAIIGSKDFALNIINYIKRSNEFQIIGFFDDLQPIGMLVCGYPIIGKTNDIIKMFNKQKFDCVFMALGYNCFEFKQKVYSEIKGKVPLANIISPTAQIKDTAVLGEGVFISDDVYISDNAVIEDNVSITLKSVVNHGCLVKKHTFFSTNVTLAGNVEIGENCFLGVSSVVSDGVKICDNVWLAPGTVVCKDLKKGGKYISYATKLINL